LTTNIFKVSFVGDLCFQSIDNRRYVVEKSVQAVFKSSDLSVANLESPLTRSDLKRPNQPCYIKGLPEPNIILDIFDIFSLANNHILDYSADGLNETCNFLSLHGKFWFGAGKNLEEAYQPLCISHHEIPVAFVGCTRWYNAEKNKAGTTPMNIRRLSKIIERLKSEGFFIIVYPHWNYEYVSYPSPADRKRAHHLIDAGADLVVGSHPHQLHGFERYKNKYIFYSLGNFIFNLFDLSQTRFSQSFILSIHIRPNHEYSFDIHPVFTTKQGVYSLSDPKNRDLIKNIQALSQVFKNDRLHKRLFYENASLILNSTMSSLNSSSGGKGSLMALLKRLPKVELQDIFIALYSIKSCLQNLES
jgi:poly-gamma-glutamate synthesis protein (capsule biosynthesis protein)